MEDADDVGLEDRRERALDRDAAQVDDRVAAGDQRVDRGLVLEAAGITSSPAPAAASVGDVADAQHARSPAQARPQLAAEAAGGAGQQQAVEGTAGDRRLTDVGRSGCGHDAMLGAVTGRVRHRLSYNSCVAGRQSSYNWRQHPGSAR